MNGVQETLDQALIMPGRRRIWIHVGCGGFVLFRVPGGFCLSCEAGPLHPAEYAKPSDA
jgi:hypothetical protein